MNAGAEESDAAGGVAVAHIDVELAGEFVLFSEVAENRVHVDDLVGSGDLDETIAEEPDEEQDSASDIWLLDPAKGKVPPSAARRRRMSRRRSSPRVSSAVVRRMARPLRR